MDEMSFIFMKQRERGRRGRNIHTCIQIKFYLKIIF